ncbi:FAD-dependent oxidoreductase [Mammaliicoccus lentus]|uniref:FAD-dependent oxidoreductase n=1 Tax=Mammaliicoccus lentus TaxID=42858 RepID=UPI001B33283A|nr:NAD(P)/FAD-dependent oxidoreductase [Mammaliicoccus lentus]
MIIETTSKQIKAPMTIVGAGMGGLVLARVLYLQGVPVTIYEAEASTTARTQGGKLDIHERDGQIALEIAGLTNEFKSIIQEGGEASRVVDQNGKVLLDDPDDGTHGRPEVLRGDLRNILLDSLPEGTIQWNKKLTNIQTFNGGQHELTFADGSTVTTNVLVGADGAFSKVRPLLSEATPEYVGIASVETYLYDVDEKHNDAANIVGDGAMYALSPGKGFQAHREPNNIIHTYVSLKRSKIWFDEINFENPETAITQIAAEFEGWPKELTALINDSETAPVLRKVFTLPIGHRWDRVPGVTLIGDAAHLMPPAGEGANLAMFDGAKLGQAIADNLDNVEEAIAAYEASMFPRSAAAAANADKFLDVLLGERAPFELAETLREALDGNK